MGSLSLENLMRRPEAGAFLGMVFVAIFFTIFGGVLFLSPQGIASWLNVAANLGIIAVPVGFLMIAGELDISIGAMVPAASMTIAIVSGYYGLPMIVGIAATLGFGVLVGLINGMIVVRTNVPSLIVTMGTLFAIAGLVLFLSIILTNSTSVSMPNIEPWAKAVFGSFIFGTYQVLVIWWLVLSVAYFWFLHVSPWGNWVFALGGDKDSARNAGTPRTG
ncbi:MAG: ABC transporter permease [Rhodobacterales bacterium]|nr:ABC transporter permease [Rhodobacterales bacterium]